MPVIYLRLFPCSRLKTRILAELGRASRLSERLYSERINSTLCKSLDCKGKRGVVLGSSKHRPLSTLVLLDNVACSLVILSPVEFYRTCRNSRTCECSYLRYPRLSRKPCILAVYRLACRSFVRSYPERIGGICRKSAYRVRYNRIA